METYGKINGSLNTWAQTYLYPDLDNEDYKAVVFEKVENGSRTLSFTGDDVGLTQDDETIKYMVFVNPDATYDWGDGYLEGFQAYYRIAKEYCFNFVKEIYGYTDSEGNGYRPYSEMYLDGIPQGVPFNKLELSAVEVDNIFEATVTFANDSVQEDPGYSNTTYGGYGSSDYESSQTATKKWYYLQTPKSSEVSRTPTLERTDFTFSTQGATCPISSSYDFQRFLINNAEFYDYTDTESPVYNAKEWRKYFQDGAKKYDYHNLNGEYTVVDRCGEFTITCYYYNWTDVKYTALYSLTGTVNNSSFLGFPERSVLFKGADVSAVDLNTDNSTGQKSVAWKVTYHFSYNCPKQVTMIEAFVVLFNNGDTQYFAPFTWWAGGWDVVERRPDSDSETKDGIGEHFIIGAGGVGGNEKVQDMASTRGGVNTIYYGNEYMPVAWKDNPPSNEDLQAWVAANENGGQNWKTAITKNLPMEYMMIHSIYPVGNFNNLNVNFDLASDLINGAEQ